MQNLLNFLHGVFWRIILFWTRNTLSQCQLVKLWTHRASSGSANVNIVLENTLWRLKICPRPIPKRQNLKAVADAAARCGYTLWTSRKLKLKHLLFNLIVCSCGKDQRFTETMDLAGRFVGLFVHRETNTMWRHWRRIYQHLDQNSELQWQMWNNHFIGTIQTRILYCQERWYKVSVIYSASTFRLSSTKKSKE